jgi:hypothetical protein
MVITTMCYTTACQQTTGCSVQPTTTISITTSEGEACTSGTGKLYNAIQSFKDAGVPLLDWMETPVTDDLLPDLGDFVQDPGDDESFENRGEVHENPGVEDDDEDSGEETSTSTSSQTETSGQGHTEQSASSLDVPTGTASGSNSPSESSCTYTTDIASSCTDGGACKVKRTIITLVLACNLEVPTLSFTPNSQNTGHTEISATALDVPTLSFTPIPQDTSTTPLAPIRPSIVSPTMNITVESHEDPTETPPSTADEPSNTRTFIQDTLTEITITPQPSMPTCVLMKIKGALGTGLLQANEFLKNAARNGGLGTMRAC